MRGNRGWLAWPTLETEVSLYGDANDDTDKRVRVAAFEFLRTATTARGEELPRPLLLQGFEFEGRRVPLLGPAGIFKPAVLNRVPLSITTVPVVEGKDRPYEDELDGDGRLVYRYRGTDPRHRDNVGLRTAKERGTPLIYFFGVVPGWYIPVWPVFVVGEDAGRLAFLVLVDAAESMIDWQGDGAMVAGEDRRRYITQTVQARLHQSSFRRRVLSAYLDRCAICRLRRVELLDAAHILPDGHPLGRPVVPNGLSLCKLHHAAFDHHILGVRPDLVVEIRHDVLAKSDGPMLLHGLKEFQHQSIVVPRSAALRPCPEFLAERYDLFRKAS